MCPHVIKLKFKTTDPHLHDVFYKQTLIYKFKLQFQLTKPLTSFSKLKNLRKLDFHPKAWHLTTRGMQKVITISHFSTQKGTLSLIQWMEEACNGKRERARGSDKSWSTLEWKVTLRVVKNLSASYLLYVFIFALFHSSMAVRCQAKAVKWNTRKAQKQRKCHSRIGREVDVHM